MELPNTQNFLITIGTDIVKNERIERNIDNLSFIKRILSPKEIEIFNKIKSKQRKIEFLAGRFSAKESIVKAINYKLNFNEISIDSNANVEITGNLENILTTLGVKRIHFKASISHEREYTVSTCIALLEK
ncbi:MAG: holo-ACP synthase [Candidatus Calescibacterium sp.]|nr:holo-ACP synthase [Candidatus Calescibacterium sp.]MCX7972004.1 holo-ACP synthase [bacterium]MDW8195492.1 holo-ACP synthase [Candidatus Calescibacterium sp.]